jgi:hypothetical protein
MERNGRWILYLIFFAFVVIAAVVFTSLPPHTDPGVERLDNRKALLHDDEQLVLWIPVGKSYGKYTVTFHDEKVEIRGFLYKKEKDVIEGCVEFRVQLIYVVTGCKESSNLIVEWPFPIRWAD